MALNHAILFSFTYVATLPFGVFTAGVSSAARVLRSSVQSNHGAASSTVLSPGTDPAMMGTPSSLSSVAHILSYFHDEAEANERLLTQRHTDEATRLQIGIAQSDNKDVKLALAQSATNNEESLRETQRVYDNMREFTESMRSLLQKANNAGGNCQQISCGEFSSCTETPAGAKCMCNEGYVGIESTCRAPPEFAPHKILLEGEGSRSTVADLQVTLLEANKIGIVFRDTSKSNAGNVIVGVVKDSGKVDLGPPEQFTADGAAAFDPVIAGAGNGRMAIAWRDQHREGHAWVRGATVGASGIRGAELFVQWGPSVAVSKGQSHKMSIVALPKNRCALMYNDQAEAAQGQQAESYGTAALVEIGHQGEASIQSTYRFMDGPVCRIEAVKVKPTGFLLAGRATPLVPDVLSSYTQSSNQEAIAIYGEMVDDDLVFDPNVLSLAPNKTQIWARGVSLIAPDTVAYAYQEGGDLQIKMSVVQINPTTHRMEVTAGPRPLHDGFSPYVSMLSMPYTASDPHTLVYFQDDSASSSKVNVCAWASSSQTLDRCENFVWLPHKLGSVSGVHLAGGRVLMVFTNEEQEPYYTVFGLTKK
mmetsp:Transcript_52009/g.96275  ORF Transcript_52009/g.96275 Transcript_52009/m.96275 type:complete len:590 (-) Transcript_52009:100-1869(-)